MLGNLFGKRNIELTPRLALAVASIYIISADGYIPDEEVGSLATIFGGDEGIIETAVEYVKQNSDAMTNVSKIANILSAEQKEIVIINLLDVLLADGEASETEKEIFFKFAEAFNFDQAKLEPIFDIISKKNSISLLS